MKMKKLLPRRVDDLLRQHFFCIIENARAYFAFAKRFTFFYHILSFYEEKALYIGVARIYKKCYTYDGMQEHIGINKEMICAKAV